MKKEARFSNILSSVKNFASKAMGRSGTSAGGQMFGNNASKPGDFANTLDRALDFRGIVAKTRATGRSRVFMDPPPQTTKKSPMFNPLLKKVLYPASMIGLGGAIGYAADHDKRSREQQHYPDWNY